MSRAQYNKTKSDNGFNRAQMLEFMRNQGGPEQAQPAGQRLLPKMEGPTSLGVVPQRITSAELPSNVDAPLWDAMTFGDAFKAARGRGMDTFNWKGKSYGTQLAAPKARPVDYSGYVGGYSATDDLAKRKEAEALQAMADRYGDKSAHNRAGAWDMADEISMSKNGLARWASAQPTGFNTNNAQYYMGGQNSITPLLNISSQYPL